MRCAFDYEAARDRVISDIANQLYDIDVIELDADDEAGRKWLWNECEVEAIKQVEAIEAARGEEAAAERFEQMKMDREFA